MYSCLAERTITGRQWVAYGHIILLVLYRKFTKKVATRIAKNCRRRQPHSHLMTPPRGTPAYIAYNLYLQKLYSLAYIFVADIMGLTSFKFVQWAPKDASFLQQSAFWPFKVIQGR